MAATSPPHDSDNAESTGTVLEIGLGSECDPTWRAEEREDISPSLFYDNMRYLHGTNGVPLPGNGTNLCWLLELPDAVAEAVQWVMDEVMGGLTKDWKADMMMPDEVSANLMVLPGFDHPDDFAGVIDLLRSLGRQVACYPQAFGADGPQQRWSNLDLSDEDMRRLGRVAAHSPRILNMRRTASGVEVVWAPCGFLSMAIVAVHDLLPILQGKGTLLRCAAPAEGTGSGPRKCGRYFVSGGHVGRPKTFCSEKCQKRAERVRRNSG